ncbi:glycosyltransferase family 4 protein [Paraburkholderia sp. A1RO-5]|uniref:glycosyltransferase family 4 protein n=1 Tax=Paraburkholderia sp. A1RO-5 TaxID=3028369 RepID=UPI003B81A3E2
MRILFLSNLYPPVVLGGYEIACANMATALKERGHEVQVLTTWNHLPISNDPKWVERALDLHWYIPHKSQNSTVDERDLHNAVCSSYANTLQLLTRLREFQPDIVYVWNLTGIGGAALLDILNITGVPWALHMMDRVPVDIASNTPAHILGLFNAQGSALYEQALIISMSQHLLDEIEEMCGITFAQGAELVPGAVDVSMAAEHLPYLTDGHARFVTAGSVNQHKGIDLILEASARLKSEGSTNFSVDIFGDGELPRYVDIARGLQIDDRVRFMGPRKQRELLQLYSNYDAFLFPTWEREPFGFAPVEAAGCGTPPIMTRNCGASERLVEGVHCLKVERNVDDLLDAMKNVASGKVDLARMGRAGIRLVASDLSLSRCLERVEAALTSHARSWRRETVEQQTLPLLAFLKHNLSLSLRFG